jgi:hypothetical protein
MKIRAQLVLACFLLSVLPLSVIVVYSYESSRRALEAASRREADVDQFAAAAAVPRPTLSSHRSPPPRSSGTATGRRMMT